MFEKFAKLQVLRPRHPAPHAAPANDNSRGAQRPGSGRVRRSPLLICRWSNEQGLTCHWEVDSTGGSNPLLDDEPRPNRSQGSRPSSRPNKTLHKSVFGPSYTTCERGAPRASRLLQARHYSN
jgi:hypothetical protein